MALVGATGEFVAPSFLCLLVTVMPELPNKLYFKIGEVAKITGVASHVLRYWESEFTTITPKRTNSGQRLYRQEEIKQLLELKELLHEKGYTISGAKKLLAKKEGAAKVKRKPPSTTFKKLQQIKRELADLQKIVSL